MIKYDGSWWQPPKSGVGSWERLDDAGRPIPRDPAEPAPIRSVPLREWWEGEPATDHRLLRLDIISLTYDLQGGGRELRLAHCSCGARAQIRAGQGHTWISQHRYRPCLAPAELATLFGESGAGW